MCDPPPQLSSQPQAVKTVNAGRHAFERWNHNSDGLKTNITTTTSKQKAMRGRFFVAPCVQQVELPACLTSLAAASRPGSSTS